MTSASPTQTGAIHEFAPAKLNLYLHITGRRSDGYHDLDSLVAFAGVGDELTLEPSDTFEFVIEGPQAGALAHESLNDNLVVKAAKSLAELTSKKLNVKLTLMKHLPVASGIGGGSSDAAAVLRALAKHWGIDIDDKRLIDAALRHGQDVPVCLKVGSTYMTATGTAPAPEIPYVDIVLVNPNKGLSTVDVYKTFRNGGAFTPEAPLGHDPKNLDQLVAELKTRTNDLYEPACHLIPEIRAIIAALNEAEGCRFAQMSGSGATCFGFFTDRSMAREAAASLLRAHPDWWVAQSYIPCRTDPRKA